MRRSLARVLFTLAAAQSLVACHSRPGARDGTRNDAVSHEQVAQDPAVGQTMTETAPATAPSEKDVDRDEAEPPAPPTATPTGAPSAKPDIKEAKAPRPERMRSSDKPEESMRRAPRAAALDPFDSGGSIVDTKAAPSKPMAVGTAGTGAGRGVAAGYGKIATGQYRIQTSGAGAAQEAPSSEAYKDYGKNAWTESAKDALSTFAVDVDTASYTIARRKLTEGAMPPTASVRVEEFVNYFKYKLPATDGTRPFSVTADLAPSPFNTGRHILRVALASKPLSVRERKPANLVFLVDVSGSMQSPDKLPLAKRALRILVDNLKDGDTVSLVTYAGSTRVVLPPTGLEHKARIVGALEELTAGGSTAMASGIQLAYEQAARSLRPDAISRVIVLSDGDANVGNTSHADILKSIAGKVKEGVTLSTIGFGMGNYKDETMEQLANKGNGNNFYIDGISQARRVFQEQLGSTLEVVAKDVKIQVDFDPASVARYRLVGYENRDVADVDFRNDKVDAGEIGAGHQVTAVYELELTAKRGPTLGTVRVRHKEPRGDKATEAAFPVTSVAAPRFDLASSELRFAFAAAAFADVLRGSEDAEHWGLAEVRRIAAAAAGDDGDRKEMVALVDRAIALTKPTQAMAR